MRRGLTIFAIAVLLGSCGRYEGSLGMPCGDAVGVACGPGLRCVRNASPAHDEVCMRECPDPDRLCDDGSACSYLARTARVCYVGGGAVGEGEVCDISLQDCDLAMECAENVSADTPRFVCARVCRADAQCPEGELCDGYCRPACEPGDACATGRACAGGRCHSLELLADCGGDGVLECELGTACRRSDGECVPPDQF